MLKTGSRHCLNQSKKLPSKFFFKFKCSKFYDNKVFLDANIQLKGPI